MSMKYYIEVENNTSVALWELLSENFECIIEKMQHSENGEEFKIFTRLNAKNKLI